MPTIAASFMFVPLAEASSGHHSSLYLSAPELVRSENPDLPHTPERDMTYYTSSVEAGTARTGIFIGPAPPTSWDGSEWYGSYGPNIFGD